MHRTVDVSNQFYCNKCVVLATPKADVALDLLHRIADQVQPIMEKRKWSVGTLAEFYPKQKNLLGININMGQTIRIRLRYAHDETRFMPYEELVCTMLHELSHIVRGPHDNIFWDLYHELRDECEELMARRIVGRASRSVAPNKRSSITHLTTVSGAPLAGHVSDAFPQGGGRVLGTQRSAAGCNAPLAFAGQGRRLDPLSPGTGRVRLSPAAAAAASAASERAALAAHRAAISGAAGRSLGGPTPTLTSAAPGQSRGALGGRARQGAAGGRLRSVGGTFTITSTGGRGGRGPRPGIAPPTDARGGARTGPIAGDAIGAPAAPAAAPLAFTGAPRALGPALYDHLSLSEAAAVAAFRRAAAAEARRWGAHGCRIPERVGGGRGGSSVPAALGGAGLGAHGGPADAEASTATPRGGDVATAGADAAAPPCGGGAGDAHPPCPVGPARGGPEGTGRPADSDMGHDDDASGGEALTPEDVCGGSGACGDPHGEYDATNAADLDPAAVIDLEAMEWDSDHDGATDTHVDGIQRSRSDLCSSETRSHNDRDGQPADVPLGKLLATHPTVKAEPVPLLTPHAGSMHPTTPPAVPDDVDRALSGSLVADPHPQPPTAPSLDAVSPSHVAAAPQYAPASGDARPRHALLTSTSGALHGPSGGIRPAPPTSGNIAPIPSAVVDVVDLTDASDDHGVPHRPMGEDDDDVVCLEGHVGSSVPVPRKRPRPPEYDEDVVLVRR